jgi:hypothetical protein
VAVRAPIGVENQAVVFPNNILEKSELGKEEYLPNINAKEEYAVVEVLCWKPEGRGFDSR